MPAKRSKGKGAAQTPFPPRREPDPEPEQVPRRFVWWDSGGSARPRCLDEYLSSVPADVRMQMDATISRYLEGVSRRQDVDHLGDGIYEFRRRKGNNHYRILFFHCGRDVVALTAFYKNQQRTPKQDIDRAIKRRAAWQAARSGRSGRKT